MADIQINLEEYQYVPLNGDEGKIILKKIGEESYVQVSATKEIIDFYNLPGSAVPPGGSDVHNDTGINENDRGPSTGTSREPLKDNQNQSDNNNNQPGTDGTVDEGENSVQLRWSRQHVLLLLASYEDKEPLTLNGKMSKKKLFDLISQELNGSEFQVTGAQCKTKIESLKRQYKAIKDHNNKSGNDRRTWPYLDRMDEIFGSKPWVKPLSTACSTINKENDVSNTSQTPSCSTTGNKTGQSSTAGNKTVQSSTPKNKRVVDLLNNLRNMKEKQHEERMKQRQEALQLLQLLVNAFANKQND